MPMRRIPYREPVFDRWRNRLRGFAESSVQRGNRITNTQYLWGSCLAEDALQQQGPCTSAENDPWEAVMGLPKIVKTLGLDWDALIR